MSSGQGDWRFSSRPISLLQVDHGWKFGPNECRTKILLAGLMSNQTWAERWALTRGLALQRPGHGSFPPELLQWRAQGQR